MPTDPHITADKPLRASLQTKIEDAEREIERLRIRLEVLRQLQSELGGPLSLSERIAPLSSPPPDESVTNIDILNGMGPKSAVLSLLAIRPGLTNDQVVDLLKDRIRSAADDKRRTLQSTIYNLISDGSLRRDRSGCLHNVDCGGNGHQT